MTGVTLWYARQIVWCRGCFILLLKFRLKEEGNELVTNCNQLKMTSPKNGKNYKTDVADIEQLLRIIQSIPSKKAEPFKQWMAQVAAQRID